jgi:hypothetical protein
MDRPGLRLALLAAGWLLLLAGTGGWLAWLSLLARPPLARPAFAWHPASRHLGALFAALAALGLALVALGAPRAALAAACVLGGGLAAWRLRRRPARRRRRVDAALAAFERDRPGADSARLREAFLAARRPEWGEELAAQIVADQPAREEFVRTVAELERRLGR